jgi:hypothetical protein
MMSRVALAVVAFLVIGVSACGGRRTRGCRQRVGDLGVGSRATPSSAMGLALLEAFGPICRP